MKIWDITGGRELLTLSAIGEGDLAFRPDGCQLSYVSAIRWRQEPQDARVQVWDASPLPEDYP